MPDVIAIVTMTQRVPAVKRSPAPPRALPTLPVGPDAITAGSSLNSLLDREAIECLAQNIALVHPAFESKAFVRRARSGLTALGIMARGHHLAHALREHLPKPYERAVEVLVASLTPPLSQTKGNGLGVFFYLPHVLFVAHYGLDEQHNDGRDPFDVSMRAQYELTMRFSAEFSMRPFLIRWPERTLAQLLQWTMDRDPHVRRLCSEGARPRLPWAMRIPSLVRDPRPTLPILDALKDDPSEYVRRSVANHVGDIAKDHCALALDLCERWLEGASSERLWVIRHALRYPAKKGDRRAIGLRKRAAGRSRR